MSGGAQNGAGLTGAYRDGSSLEGWQTVSLHLFPAAHPQALRLTFADGRRLDWALDRLVEIEDLATPDQVGLRPEYAPREKLVLRGPAVVAELRKLAPGLAETPADADPRLFANYANGHDARWQRVELQLVPGDKPRALRLILPDGEALDWPLADLRRLPDHAGKHEVCLHPAGDGPERLVMKGEGVVAEIATLAPNLGQRPPAHNPGRIAKWSLAAVASVALIVFGLVPLMADRLAVFLPPEGEKALGDTTFDQIRSVLANTDGGAVWICEDPDGLAALDKIRARLNADADLPYDIQINVLDHEMVNAFALPGGRIVFFRGLIDEAANADEVAAVMAHEIGHVVNRDPTRDALRSAGSIGVLGLLFGDFAGGTVVLFLANQLINANYSQAAEAGADDYAHGLMADAGLSPAALGTFFERLHAEYGDADGLVAHFSSHPQMLDRIAAAQAAAEGFVAREPLLSDGEWQALRGVCGTPAPAAPAATDEASQGAASDPAPGDSGRRRIGQ